jgi:hypothetical protein
MLLLVSPLLLLLLLDGGVNRPGTTAVAEFTDSNSLLSALSSSNFRVPLPPLPRGLGTGVAGSLVSTKLQLSPSSLPMRVSDVVELLLLLLSSALPLSELLTIAARDALSSLSRLEDSSELTSETASALTADLATVDNSLAGVVICKGGGSIRVFPRAPTNDIARGGGSTDALSPPQLAKVALDSDK